MRDVRLEAIKERKLGEITLYASMIRLDIGRRNEYFALMTMINRDVDLIESLLSDGVLPETAPIRSQIYVSRLSESEIEDEKYLDGFRNGVADAPDAAEIIAEEIAEEAASEIAAEEPSVEEIVAVETAAEDVPAIEDDVSEEEIPEEEDVIDSVLSDKDISDLKKIREMKNSKIDLFIERELFGNFKEEACEDIIRFTKIDIRIIDIFLRLDNSDEDVLRSDLKTVVGIVNSMEPPKFGKMYANSLNKEEAKLEIRYNELLDKVDDLVRLRFPEIVPQNE